MCRAAQPPRKRYSASLSFCRWFSKAWGRLKDIPTPNLSFRSAIDDLEVHCKFGTRRKAQAGGWEHDPLLCPQILKRSEAAAHEAACSFRVVECMHRDSGGRHANCPHRCRHRDLTQHAAECELRPASCVHAGCGAVLSANRAAGHAFVCGHRPCECPNDGCSTMVSAAALAEHRAVCGREEVECGYDGCGVRMLREGVEAHDHEQWRQHLALTSAALKTQRAELTTAFRAEMATQRQELTTQLTTAFQAQMAAALQGVVGGAGPAPAQVLHVPRDHTTLQAAVNAARASERVVLAAGVYNGNVTIRNKQVEIVGVAQGGRVVLEYEGNGNVVFAHGAAATVTLSNLTIRHRGGATDGLSYGAIVAYGGSTVQVEGCDLSSEGGGGVYALQEDTDLRLKDCTVHNCKFSGVQISTKAKATVEGCTSRDNRMSGIQVQEGASATLRGNTCTGNQHGICVNELEGNDPTSAVVENNQLTGNTRQNLYVAALCHARVQRANNTV